MYIGIISMQEIKNNGSYLQAYALYHMLSEQGADVDFISFENPIVKRDEMKAAAENRRILKCAGRKIKHMILPKYWRYEKVKASNRRFCAMLPQYYPLIGIGKLKEKDIQEQHFDLVIVGSDEVFSVLQFAQAGTGIPWRLLGEGVRYGKILSYAASAGQTNAEGLEEYGHREKMAACLRSFDSLSVRDANTANLVQTLTGREPVRHVDPVLAYEVFPEDPDYQKLPYNYLLVYAYSFRIHDAAEIKAVRDFAEKKKLKILCVNVFQTWADKYIVASPFALLQYIRDAAYVVTDTFHGAVFSIRENKPFAVFIRGSNANKLGGLLAQFGLERQRIGKPSELEQCLQNEIDYSAVNAMLTAERKRTRAYLQAHLIEEQK